MKPDCRKIVQVVNYLTRKCGEDVAVPELKIIKLVWAADRYHLRKYARTVTNDDYVAMMRGPVGSSTKDVIEFETNFGRVDEKDIDYSKRYINFSQNNDSMLVKSIAETDLSELSETDVEALDFAIENFGKMDTYDLINFTHQYPEWKKHEEKLDENNRSRNINLLDFFDNPEHLENDPFQISSNLLETSKEIYNEYV